MKESILYTKIRQTTTDNNMLLKDKIDNLMFKNGVLNKRMLQLSEKREDIKTLFEELKTLFPDVNNKSELLYLGLGNNIGVCGTCARPTKFKSFVIGYNQFCCKDCADKDGHRNDKRLTTLKERYGEDYQATINAKRMETNLERYGVMYPLQNQAIRNQTHQTQITEHGGVGFQNEQTRERAQQILLNKFGKKSGNASSKNESVLSQFSDPDFIRFEYIENKKSILCLSKEYGVSCRAIRQRIQQNNIELQYNNISFPQQKLIKYFRDNNIHFILNDRTVLQPRELDFYLPDHNLAIEVNGLWWHSDNYGWPKNGHLFKTLKCNEQNIHLLHFWEFEINDKFDIVTSIINNFININQTIYARKCQIVSIDCKEFISTNHINGNAAAQYYYALKYNNEIVAAMSFGRPRYSKQAEYELIRYVNKQGINVVGGASKLLKHFIKQINPNSIISYSDKRLFSGNMYNKMGFNKLHTSKPNYHYFKEGTYKLMSRVKFQKHKLNKILAIFDTNASEWNNMKNNGYNRVWDCGTDVWILKKGQ